MSPSNSIKPLKIKRRKPNRKQKKLLKNAQRQVLLAERKLEISKATAALFEDNINQIQPHLLMESTDVVIGRVTGCTLIEVRKGARISERTTNFSSTGSSGSVRIGAMSLGGSSRNGSSHSTSVSFPPPDELQRIDTGTLILSTKAISFVGKKFARSTPFSKMLQIEIEDMSLLIASSTSSKVWICEFGDHVDLMTAGSVLAALWNTKNSDQNKADYFEETIQTVRDDLAEAISEANTSFKEATLLQNHLAIEF